MLELTITIVVGIEEAKVILSPDATISNAVFKQNQVAKESVAQLLESTQQALMADSRSFQSDISRLFSMVKHCKDENSHLRGGVEITSHFCEAEARQLGCEVYRIAREYGLAEGLDSQGGYFRALRSMFGQAAGFDPIPRT